MDVKIAEGRGWEVRIDTTGHITLRVAGYHGEVNWLRTQGIEIPKEALRAKNLIENKLFPAANHGPITTGQRKRYKIDLSPISHTRWRHWENKRLTFSIFCDRINKGSVYEKQTVSE